MLVEFVFERLLGVDDAAEIVFNGLEEGEPGGIWRDLSPSCGFSEVFDMCVNTVSMIINLFCILKFFNDSLNLLLL